MQPASSDRSLFVFYHYLFPDSVVSAVLMDELCQGLVSRGWDVTGFPANRGCRDENLTYPSREIYRGVKLRRIWRPKFRQASPLGRLLNAAWMITRWSLLAIRPHPPAAIVIGTDPILSVSIALVWKFFRPHTRIIHWCFDLYPEAAVADGFLSPNGLSTRIIRAILRRAYSACDVIVDIGPCMRRRLARYAAPARNETIVPWALAEHHEVLPLAADERRQIFGASQLALLYSGSYGRAHTHELFLALARKLREASAGLVFSIRGNREDELRSAVAALEPKTTCPISFIPFASSEQLSDRLAAPDIHLLSLADNWTGLVVPSKFFGAIAAGRPVLFCGDQHSAIAQWVREYQLGWCLTSENIDLVAADLLAYVGDPDRIRQMQKRCFDTYQSLFSKQASLDHMQSILEDLLTARRQT